MQDTVLVTGASGFIGSHLVEALVRRGLRVRALVRYSHRPDLGNLDLAPSDVLDAVDVQRGDVTDPFFVRRCVDGCASVFHLAALISIPFSYQSPRHVFDVNVFGSLHVAEACAATGAWMVHTSTSEVYGSAQTVPITEQHPLVGQSPYAASKIAADQCVESFRRSLKLRGVTLRPFNTYGPRQSARAVIPTIITQALAGDVVKLGALHPTRDLNFVTDTVAGFVAAGAPSEAIHGATLQLGTGVETSIGDLATKILGIVRGAARLVHSDDRVRPAASEVERLVADASKARAALGWSPEVSLDEGLARTIDFVRAHPTRYRPGEFLP